LTLYNCLSKLVLVRHY